MQDQWNNQRHGKKKIMVIKGESKKERHQSICVSFNLPLRHSPSQADTPFLHAHGSPLTHYTQPSTGQPVLPLNSYHILPISPLLRQSGSHSIKSDSRHSRDRQHGDPIKRLYAGSLSSGRG